MKKITRTKQKKGKKATKRFEALRFSNLCDIKTLEEICPYCLKKAYLYVIADVLSEIVWMDKQKPKNKTHREHVKWLTFLKEAIEGRLTNLCETWEKEFAENEIEEARMIRALEQRRKELGEMEEEEKEETPILN